MKRLISFLLLVTFFSMRNTSGQEISNDLNNKWSASVSYSPITTFFYYHPEDEYPDYHLKGVNEYKYPWGVNVELSRQINNRISVNMGLNFKSRPGENLIYKTAWFSSYYEKSIDNRYIFEMPVNLKYNLRSSPGIFDPYIKTGLRGSYFKRYYVGEYTSSDIEGTINGVIDNHDGKLIIFYEIGAGSYLNLSKSFAFLLGSNLTYTFSGFGYLELQAGFKYSF